MVFLLVIDEPEEKRKFVLIYEKYRYLLYKVVFDVLQDSYLAEDALQEAFWKIAKNMEKLGEIEALATKRYIITVAKGAAIDIYRKRKRQMREEIYVDELSSVAEPCSYMETDVDNAVLDILKNLPVKYRDVFLLKYSSNMENEEIARLLGITEEAVRKRISRGKVMVQEALDKMEEM
ncbi:MAG: RNA polymerase sigma factor [Lachnospiraceae bacterium]|nr:RNA polymerase sigma factor [Lachnospiraceae bacterium]